MLNQLFTSIMQTCSSLDFLLNILFGHLMWWWEVSHPRAFNHSSVPFGVSPSSLCNSINSFCARTLNCSNCVSSWEKIYKHLVNTFWFCIEIIIQFCYVSNFFQKKNLPSLKLVLDQICPLWECSLLVWYIFASKV